MNNIEKKLDALIDALGFDVEEIITIASEADVNEWNKMFLSRHCSAITTRPVDDINYKLTKRNTVKKKPKAWIICPLCEGNGNFECYKAAGKCPECDGAGKVSSNE